MNLIEAERLVRKIRDVLQHRASEAQARSLAQAYAEVCQVVNHRLTQCAVMLAQGDEHQALQLAEAPPPVLELASRLAFRESEEWRQYCYKQDLALAEPLEGSAIRQINGSYGKGISADHALYREYRQAVLLHQDAQAVKALRSISWRNPADPNAPRELERLERKILRGRLEELEHALRSVDEGRVMTLIAALEALDFQLRPGGPVWKEAQETRCRVLLKEAAQCRTQERWNDAAAQLTELRALVAEHQLALSPRETEQAAELEHWVAACHQEETERARFARLVTELRQMLAQAEEQQVSGELPDREESRERLETLRHRWREIELAERPISQELLPRVNKALHLLETRLARLERRRRASVLAVLGVFILAALALSLFFWQRRQARDIAAELESLQHNRQVTALEQRMAQLRNPPSRLAGSRPVKAAMTVAEEFLHHERQQEQECKAALARLQALAEHGFTELAPDQVQARFDEAGRNLGAAAKDYQRALRAQFLPLQAQWENWLDTRRNARAEELTRRWKEAQATATQELRYDRGPEAVRATLNALAPRLCELEEMAAPAVARLAPPVDLQGQVEALRQRVQAFAGELEKWEQVQAAWRTASSLEGYLESLKLFQRCEFTEPDQARAAAELLALNVSEHSLKSALLLPATAQPPQPSQPQTELRWHPDDVMPGERTRLRDLRDDENIHNVRAYRRTLRLLPEGQTNRVRTVYLSGLWDNTRSTLQRGLIYDPSGSPNELAFRRQESYSEVLYEEIGPTPEAQAFEAIGARQLLDHSATNYSGSLLAVLDRINRDTSSSPLFRAWLFLRLCELMELRPAEWGAGWAPALAVDRQQLRSLGASGLHSGDWLVPARQLAFGPGLEDHFSRARQVSYEEQARFLYELGRRADEAGFSLVGHVDNAGKPVVPGTSVSGAEWCGWAAETRSPALLFRKQAGESGLVALKQPLAFSPLLQFRGDPKQLTAVAKQSLGSQAPHVGAWLPPLFAAHE